MTLLPQPDSPTRPMTDPGRTRRETPVTSAGPPSTPMTRSLTISSPLAPCVAAATAASFSAGDDGGTSDSSSDPSPAIEITSGAGDALRVASMLLEGIEASPIIGNPSSTSLSTLTPAGRSSATAAAAISVTGVLLFLRRSATRGGGIAVPPASTSASEFAAMMVRARMAPVGTIIQGSWKMKREAA